MEEEPKATTDTRRWVSPIIVAILAAAVAGLGNAGVALLNANSQADLEKQRAEQERILEVIKTGNTESAAANLRFLLDAGLIDDNVTRMKLTAYLHARKPGSGPALPTTAGDAAEFVSEFEGTVLKPYRDAVGTLVIGSGHVITEKEQQKGEIVIDGKPVPYAKGITPAQANALLAQELAPLRRKVDDLVTVPLAPHQLDALTSFVYNVGFDAMRGRLLKELNAGDYDAVPTEMRRWTKVGSTTLASLVRRRKAEIALWNLDSK